VDGQDWEDNSKVRNNENFRKGEEEKKNAQPLSTKHAHVESSEVQP